MKHQIAKRSEFSAASLPILKDAEIKISKIVSEGRDIMQQAVQLLRHRAFEIGKVLEETKRKIEHGDFQKWINKNTVLALSTAEWYHKYYIGLTQIPSARDLNLKELPSIRSVTECKGSVKKLGNDLITREEVWQFGNLVAPKEEKEPRQKPAAEPAPLVQPHQQWAQKLSEVILGVQEHFPKFHPKDREHIASKVREFAQHISGVIVTKKEKK